MTTLILHNLNDSLKSSMTCYKFTTTKLEFSIQPFFKVILRSCIMVNFFVKMIFIFLFLYVLNLEIEYMIYLFVSLSYFHG
jgi:hypothetical protein